MKIATQRKNAYTLIELLAVMFIIVLTTTAYHVVRAKHGPGLAAVAAALAILTAVLLVILFYRWAGNRDKRQLTQLREKYRTIYQVKELPADTGSIVKPEWAEIQIGDYGWDARPNRRDGLVHLQGLTKQWHVVWHAGFRPDQIEKVAEKPGSQYDYCAPYWAKRQPLPPCPFPIQDRNTPTMGRPHHSGRYSKNYPSQYYLSPSKIESPPSPPVMTAAEFTSWSKVPGRQFQIGLLLFIAMVFGISQLCFYMDHLKPAPWIQFLTACGIIGVVIVLCILPNRMAKRAAKKHGFPCPACGNQITALAGLAGWPRRELCNRCGTRVIEFNDQNTISKAGSTR